MSENTKIEWCDHTWNPWRGCTKVSPGCANCYAETLSHRNPAVLGQWGKGKPRVLAKNWGDPLKWNKAAEGKFYCTGCGRVGPSKTWREELLAESQTAMACCPDNAPRPYRPAVFPSLCDWLDDEVPIEWFVRFLGLIKDTPNIDWLLLTKRPENFRSRIEAAMEPAGWIGRSKFCADWYNGTPQHNVWVGTSVEDQQRADERIPELLKIPAKLRFLSVEPLLGPVDLSANRGTHDGSGLCWDWAGEPIHVPHCDYKAIGKEPPKGPRIDWIIIGGESGPKSRMCNVEWVRSIVRQCKKSNVPLFVKQLGARPTITPQGYCPEFGTPQPPIPLWNVSHPKGGDPDEWPDDLQVRQFPEVEP